ncbi:glycosyl transferase family 2 [Gloeothece citriformis PCC 7424]|uniref:Glycosyl transferase family 2 n=1 Tax=Gloeothece citriformis (strain PCC 7424) TaxID=65393 RepID=B7K7D2_GLOC7|nr:glycosyltransferase family 2 protein [Gloeothece citriformis]ACK69700.1 glycosyl transferase family 2 [Gloeothece citriformis PCC 7424]
MVDSEWNTRLQNKKIELERRRIHLLKNQIILDQIHNPSSQDHLFIDIPILSNYNKSQKTGNKINIKPSLKVLYWILTFQLKKRLQRQEMAQLISQSGLFDADFYGEKNPELKKSQVEPLSHYLDIGSVEGRDPHPLFDTQYYLKQNPEVAASQINPLVHYILVGALNGKNPHPLFNTAYYIEKNLDVGESGMNPLVHYINHGAKEGRNPHPLFDTSYYVERYLNLISPTINPLVHYLQQGAKQRYNPNPLFDTSFYIQQNPKLLELETNPLIHYINIGAKQGLNPHPLFDTAFYLKQSQTDLVHHDPLAHFFEFGALEGRDPHPLFDTSYYVERYSQLIPQGMNPLVHYLQEGAKLGYNPNPLFDTSFYLEENATIFDLEINPLIHYINIGFRQGLNPHPLFDTAFYLKQLGSSLEPRINPLIHFLEIGACQGLDPHPLFDTSHYLEKNSDVRESGMNPLVHFVQFGAIEKREPFSISEMLPEMESQNWELKNFKDFSCPKSPNPDYQKWLQKNYPTPWELEQKSRLGNCLKYKPLISVIMPVYNPPENYLREAIESVLNQVYSNWELCIADDASTEPHVKLVLNEYLKQDSRIKVIFRENNGHISKASNSALELATGEFIALLDHDDVLTPHAFYELALLLNSHPEADMIYSDQDYMDDQGQLINPYFKPDWSPDAFLANMYTCHLGLYRHSIVKEIGGFRVGFEGSQDYDLVLRFTEKTERIFHLPDILYHWRTHAASTNINPQAKSYAFIAARKALAEALTRRKEPGAVFDIPNYPGCYTIRYQIKDPELVSIIITTKNLGERLDNCLTSIFQKTTYQNYEVILIDNGSTEPQALETIEHWKNRENFRLKYYGLELPFNSSKINNFAVDKSQGKYLLFLKNETKILTSDWLEKMIEQAQRPSIGAVGALLLYPDNTVQHAGVICGLFGRVGHSHKHYQYGASGYFGRLVYVHNYMAVTGACLMCRREVFEEVGGFEEKLAVSYNDIDLCLKLIDKGYRNLCLPHVVLYHYESKTRGYDSRDTEKFARLMCENMYISQKWQKYINYDPYYNPNLTSKKEDFSLNI